jgi:hypothetical protein
MASAQHPQRVEPRKNNIPRLRQRVGEPDLLAPTREPDSVAPESREADAVPVRLVNQGRVVDACRWLADEEVSVPREVLPLHYTILDYGVRRRGH